MEKRDCYVEKEKMKVVIIAVPIMDQRGQRFYPIEQDASLNCTPYGLYLLVNVLRQQGHQVTMVDLNALGTRSLRKFEVVICEADLIGIGANSISWPTALDVIRQVRKIKPNITLVLGGIHPSMFDQYILEKYPVDYIVRGEGELAFPALCEALEQRTSVHTIHNLSWKTSEGKFIRNPIGPKIDLSRYDFPLPAYEDLPSGVYHRIAIESSRGCAFDCAFCSTSYRKSWREMRPEIFVERLTEVIPHLPLTIAHTIQIIDFEFSTNPRRAMTIFDILRKKEIKIGLLFESRADDLLQDGLIESMAEYTYAFQVGAECGYDEGLQLIGKGTTCEELEAAAKKLSGHGIADRAYYSFILGLPWENKKEIEQTIKFAVRLSNEYGIHIMLQWYWQFPGSRLWEKSRKTARVTEAMYDEYGFFRNLHLWHSSHRITPKQAWEIEEMILTYQWLGLFAYPDTCLIMHAIPEQLKTYFPRNILSPNGYSQDALNSLCEISDPPGKAM